MGCVSTKKGVQKSVKSKLNNSFHNNQFTGLIVFDLENRETIINSNGDKYFTPASTTKIFTLYTALQLLGSNIPSLKYKVKNDTMFIEGTGDPTVLHSHFKKGTFTSFLKKHKHIGLHLNNFSDTKYGPGWAWEDYQYYFQPEKSGLPLYGNVVTIYPKNKLQVLPSFFKDQVVLGNNSNHRELTENLFYFSPTQKDTLEVPFITSKELTKALLEDIIQKEITVVPEMPKGEKNTLYGVASDSVYKQMMLESDNFIAEQILIMASSTLSDTLNAKKAQNYILDSYLDQLKQKPRWVDGSGLSRYNLFTPESMIQVLEKLYNSLPQERLFNLFPVGGVSGGLENWYVGDSKPYIYAKTGSLGNNHNLCGYLITNSGKTLAFSFMNNHFMKPSKEIKKEMQQVLEEIRDTY